MSRAIAATISFAMTYLVAICGTCPFTMATEPGPVAAGATSDTVARPARAVISATKVDLGKVPRGKRAAATFVVTNTGESPLEISSKPHCGCTVVYHDKVIPPGRRGALTTEIATSSLSGNFHKTVELWTNDPEHRVFQLALAGSVVEAVEIAPSPHPAVNLKMEGPTELDLELHTIEHVDVTRAAASEPYVETNLNKTGDCVYQVKLRLGPDAPLGRSTFVVTLSTTAEYQREIPVTVYCDKGILVTPKKLAFGSSRRSGDAVPTSMVQLARRDGIYHIRSAVSSDPNVEVRVATLKEGSLYRLIATCRGDLSAIDSAATITVNTDDSYQPQLKIPVQSMRVSQSIGKPDLTAELPDDPPQGR